jgi:tetratricopeptide (TPR) repeat protein
MLVVACLSAAGAAALEPAVTEAWNRIDSEHFTFFTNANRSLVASLATDLEKLRLVLIAMTEGITFDAPPPLSIYALKDDWTFTRLDTSADGRSRRDAGYFLWTPEAQFLAVNVVVIDEHYSALSHEYLHALLQTNFPNLPTWLDEGLAEYYGAFEIDGLKAEVGRPIPFHLARLSGGLAIPVNRLVTITTESAEYSSEPAQGDFYAESWALVHFLLADPARRETMGQFCRLLADGKPLDEALATAFHLDIPGLASGLAEHVRKGTFEFVTLTLRKDIHIPKPKMTSLQRAEALYRVGDLLARYAPSREEAAREYLLPALAKDPALAGARATLGYLALANGRYKEAQAELGRAVELDPRNAGTFALLGRATLEAVAAPGEGAGAGAGAGAEVGARAGAEAGADVGASPNQVAAVAAAHSARAWFRRGLAVDPDSVENLAGLGRTFIIDPEGAAEGITSLARARELAPGRNDLLGDLLVLMARSGNPAGAHTLLQALLRPRRAPHEIARVEEAIAAAERQPAKPTPR